MTTNAEDLITRLIVTNTATLRAEIENLKKQLITVTGSTTVVEYKTQTIDDQIRCDETLDVIKSLPEFTGNTNIYVSWREAANNSISLYTKGSRKYFAALTILRNKITQNANDILTNHGTVLNFDAIISRLDFTYADKRPAHIIEQELSILRQGNLQIVEFYNLVNQKLTLLINKTIMTHGTESTLTHELNNINRRNALRVFITGLNAPLANILFSLSPEDLPSALARAQELESNNQRAHFALQFSRNWNPQQNIDRNQNNLRFPKKNFGEQNQWKNSNLPKPEPMELGSSNTKQNFNGYYPGNQTFRYPYNNNQPRQFQNNNNYPRQNGYQQFPQRQQNVEKRLHESAQHTGQPPVKNSRINNINESTFLGNRADCPTFTEKITEQGDY